MAVMSFVILTSAVLYADTHASWRQIVPVAALTEGGNGSFWQTDLTIVNPSDRSASLTLEFLPTGLDSLPGNSHIVEIPAALLPGASITLPNVLGAYFSAYSSGALVIQAKDTDGMPVPISASSRTWTPSQEGPGTFGQGIPAVAWDDEGDLNRTTRVVTGLAQNDFFRTNLGIVNLSGLQSILFTIELYDPSGLVVESIPFHLGPQAHFQLNAILNDHGIQGEDYSARISMEQANDLTPGAPGFELPDPDFVVYGSRVDRVTNDPVYLESSGSYGAVPLLIPAAASKAGGNNSYWSTDLVLRNPSETDDYYVEIDLIPTGAEGSADSVPYTFLLDPIVPGASARIDDILNREFPGYTLGALVVKAVDPSFNLKEVDLGSRTWTPSPDGKGTFGQGIPPVPLEAQCNPVILMDLESSENFRTNLGFINFSLNLRETLLVELLSTDGSVVATESLTLEPWAHLQIDGFLDRHGIAGSGYAARVSLESTDNLFLNPGESWEPMFTAYASRVDRISNDPTYLAPSIVPAPEEEPTGEWVDFEDEHPWYLCTGDPVPEEATQVTAFDQVFHYFLGDDNQRDIVNTVEFPPAQDWNQVGLILNLECPESGLCDHWDRIGSLRLVVNPEDDPSSWEYLEVFRYITPYRLEMCNFVDITPLASYFAGEQTLVSSIDTWIGPGSVYGDGWRVSATFVFYPGTPHGPDQVVNLWSRKDIVVGFIDEENNVDSQIDPMTVYIPEDTSRVEARLIGTGHSFNNTNNCAEFCIMRMDLYANGTMNSVIPWRNDCDINPISPQYGTWQYDRNGWCPGAAVLDHRVDLTDQLVPGQDNVLDFDIRMYNGEEYNNVNPDSWSPFMEVTLQLLIYE